MSKATVTFEDEGDQVKVEIDFGEEGGQENSPAHQIAAIALSMATKVVGGSMDQGEVQ